MDLALEMVEEMAKALVKTKDLVLVLMYLKAMARMEQIEEQITTDNSRDLMETED